jgi:hypothetical protein
MITNISLKDSQGRTIQKRNLNEGEQKEFNVGSLNGGVYFVELRLPNGKAIRHQLTI